MSLVHCLDLCQGRNSFIHHYFCIINANINTVKRANNVFVLLWNCCELTGSPTWKDRSCPRPEWPQSLLLFMRNFRRREGRFQSLRWEQLVGIVWRGGEQRYKPPPRHHCLQALLSSSSLQSIPFSSLSPPGLLREGFGGLSPHGTHWFLCRFEKSGSLIISHLLDKHFWNINLIQN